MSPDARENGTSLECDPRIFAVRERRFSKISNAKVVIKLANQIAAALNRETIVRLPARNEAALKRASRSSFYVH